MAISLSCCCCCCFCYCYWNVQDPWQKLNEILLMKNAYWSNFVNIFRAEQKKRFKNFNVFIFRSENRLKNREYIRFKICSNVNNRNRQTVWKKKIKLEILVKIPKCPKPNGNSHFRALYRNEPTTPKHDLFTMLENRHKFLENIFSFCP